MKLVSFTVENYRSITKANNLPLKDFTVLVGPNNEGKSNILKALVAATNLISMLRFMPSPQQLSRWAKSNDVYDWESDYPIARQTKEPNGKTVFDLEFELSQEEVSQFRLQIKSKLNSTLPLQISIGREEVNFKVTRKGKSSEALSKKTRHIGPFISRRMECQYIPAVRTAESAQQIVDKLVHQELKSVKDDPKFLAAIQQIQALHKPILDDLAETIKKTLIQFMPSVKAVSFETAEQQQIDAIQKTYRILIDDGTPTSLDRKGDGVQSLAAIGIMRHASESGAIGKGVIIALEEPESHLHPKAIHQFRNVIHELKQKYQVVITTHCPLFVSRSNIESNIIVNNRRAKPAKNIAEVREVLGVRAADNLRHAELVLVVEGEDDIGSIKALLGNTDEGLRDALDSGSLALDSLNGGSNLSYKLGMLRDALCVSHVFLDHDKSGIEAFQAAKAEGLTTDGDCNFAMVQGKPESEFEDLLDETLYEEMLKNVYRVSLAHPKFKGKGKWSERMGEAFRGQGKIWNDRTKEEVKRKIVELVEAAPEKALHAQRRAPFDSLVSTLRTRLSEPTPTA